MTVSCLVAGRPQARLHQLPDGNSESYTMRAEGSQQVNRSQHPAFDFDPDWGPLPKH
jgi:hypothetical protein